MSKKWDLIKQKIRDLKRLKLIRDNKRRSAVHLLKLSYMTKFIKKLYKDYDNYKFELNSKELIMASSVRIYMMINKKLRKKNPDIHERQKKILQDSFNLSGMMFKDLLTERAEKVRFRIILCSWPNHIWRKQVYFTTSQNKL